MTRILRSKRSLPPRSLIRVLVMVKGVVAWFISAWALWTPIHPASLLARFQDIVGQVARGPESYTHEKGHFGQPRRHTCPAKSCDFITKRWSDLIRHCAAKQCTNRQKFSYPMPWCKYSGERDFQRKDKLKNHYKNIHEGRTTTGQPLKTTKPTTFRAIYSNDASNPASAISPSPSNTGSRSS